MIRFSSIAFLILTFAWLSINHSEPTLASSHQEDGADLPNVESLLGRLEKGSIEERIDAVNQLGALGPYAQAAVDQIVKAMSTDDLALKYECIAALGQIGPLAHDASDSLTPMLRADSNLFQVAALESLRRIGTASPDAVALIRKLSQDSDASAATSAIRCLVMIAGENDELVRNSIPRLVKALGDKRTEVRNEAVLTLVEIGPAAVSAVTAVLSDTDYHVRLSACNILGQFGSDAASAVPGLLPRLEDKEDLVVRAAATALGRIRSEPDRVLPALIALLGNKSTPIRIVAVRAVAEFGPLSKGAIPQLLTLLSEESVMLRASAATALGSIQDGRPEVIDALVGALSDTDGSVTVSAANALARIGSPAVPALVSKLSHEAFRGLIVEVLGEMGGEAESAVPALVKLLNSDDKDLRREVYISLATMGPKAGAATSALMTILQNPDAAEGRAGAAYVLAHIGEKKAVPVLKEILKTKQTEQVSRAAAWAIVKLEPENADNVGIVMPHLIQATSSEISLVRKEAMSAFCTLGKSAGDALPCLLEHAESDADPSVKALSLQGLAKIQATAAQSLPVAVASLSDPDVTVRTAARYLLGSLGEAAHSAAPMLRESLRRGDQLERIVSAWALVHVEPTPENFEAAIPLLLKGMQSPNPGVRAEVASTLGTSGTKSKEVLSELETAQKDEDPQVKQAAKEALSKLTKVP